MTVLLGYGQRDTVIIKPNDSLVIISKGLAIDITKDLVKKDYLEKKVVLLEKDTAALSQMFAKYVTTINPINGNDLRIVRLVIINVTTLPKVITSITY